MGKKVKWPCLLALQQHSNNGVQARNTLESFPMDYGSGSSLDIGFDSRNGKKGLFSPRDNYDL